MATSAMPKLKHGDFWETMDRATSKVDEWPDWMKGSPVNKREATNNSHGEAKRAALHTAMSALPAGARQ
jgi:hypothetical protein